MGKYIDCKDCQNQYDCERTYLGGCTDGKEFEEEKKVLDWQLKCAKCGFEFSIMFDSDESEENKNKLRACPCGGGLMEIIKEKVL